MTTVLFNKKPIELPGNCCLCNTPNATIKYKEHLICSDCINKIEYRDGMVRKNSIRMFVWAFLTSFLIIPPILIIFYYLRKNGKIRNTVGNVGEIKYLGTQFDHTKYSYSNKEYADTIKSLNRANLASDTTFLKPPTEPEIFRYNLSKVFEYAQSTGDKSGAIAKLRQAKKELDYSVKEVNAQTQLRSARATASTAYIKGGSKMGKYARASARQDNAKFKLMILERQRMIDSTINNINNL